MFCFHNILGGNNLTEPGKLTCGSIIVQFFFSKLKVFTLSNQEQLYRDYEKKDVIKSGLMI